MTLKSLQGIASNYLSNLFVASHNNAYNLRSDNRKVYLPKPNTNFLNTSFSYRGAESWNNLHLEIV